MEKQFNLTDFYNTYAQRWDYIWDNVELGLCYYADDKMFYVFDKTKDDNICETNDFNHAIKILNGGLTL